MCPPGPSLGEIRMEVAGECQRPVGSHSASSLLGEGDLLPSMRNHEDWGMIWADFTNHFGKRHFACKSVTLPALQI